MAETIKSQWVGTSWRTHPRHGMPYYTQVLALPLSILVRMHSIQLRKGRANTRIAKIYDSPMLAESETTFAIKTEGITDPDEEDE